ncbi:hypothetical protein H0H81_002477 [Sphagnurus paluster]|uniref:Mannosyltransferase n=1 Tax=Sphagnurus paluster TaxID=117069 RepID=A0A9P7K6B4_9AGAR|nr:hypothetical protein H0H81_002477 [Sphagnurus paluster]
MSLLIDRAPNKVRPSDKSLTYALSLLTFTAVVFRAEVALLLGPLALQSILHKNITIQRAVKVVFLSGIASLALTVSVDTYFWDSKSKLWPEFAGLYFNVYQGKSADWGTSPHLAYFTTHLPKLLLSSLPLSFGGFVRDQRIRDLLFPFFVFITLISFLGHKEWRFIIYVVPVFNVAAARGARWMVSLPKNKIYGQLMALYMPLFLCINMAITYILTMASVNNYPGGHALALLHHLYPLNPPVHVHISDLAAQTGASLFFQLNAPPYPALFAEHLKQDGREWWTYNKTESLTPTALTDNQAITHLIVEPSPVWQEDEKWKIVARLDGFSKWELDAGILTAEVSELTLERLKNVVRLEKVEKLWILERDTELL